MTLQEKLDAVRNRPSSAAREPADQADLPFTMLRDRGNAVADRYGLVFALPDDLRRVYAGFGLDLPTINGDGAWTLPVPARIVIDREGVVRDVAADPDDTRRPEPARTIALLQRLTA